MSWTAGAGACCGHEGRGKGRGGIRRRAPARRGLPADALRSSPARRGRGGAEGPAGGAHCGPGAHCRAAPAPPAAASGSPCPSAPCRGPGRDSGWARVAPPEAAPPQVAVDLAAGCMRELRACSCPVQQRLDSTSTNDHRTDQSRMLDDRSRGQTYRWQDSASTAEMGDVGGGGGGGAGGR